MDGTGGAGGERIFWADDRPKTIVGNHTTNTHDDDNIRAKHQKYRKRLFAIKGMGRMIFGT